MNHLFREKAPITPAGWDEIETEAEHGGEGGTAPAVGGDGSLGIGSLRRGGQ